MKAAIADREKTFAANQRQAKHVSAVTNNHATIKKLLEAVFSMRSLPGLYEDD
jgi:hypothetical protein